MKKIALAAMALAMASGSMLMAENWPKWRGPNGDNISKDAKLSYTWPKEAKVLWTVKVGGGYASPAALDGKLYVFTSETSKDTLRCVDANDGKILWSQSYDSAWTGPYPGTRATPYIEDKIIYTYGGAGDLTARKLEDGSEIWRLNTLKETGTHPIQWGVASNPLIVGDLIYVQTGDGGPMAVSVDKKTGKIVNKSAEKAGAGYASLLSLKIDGVDEIIVFGGGALYGMTPDLQKVLWSQPWKTQFGINASTPIYKDGMLFVSSAYGQGSMMLKVTKDGAEKVWETKDVQARFQGAILDDGYLYVSSEGSLKCMKWPDKAFVWEDKDSGNRLGMGGGMVRHGDKLIALNERGKLLLLEANPNGLPKRLASYNELVEGKEVWATPLIYEGRVYVKGAEDLVCVDVAK